MENREYCLRLFHLNHSIFLFYFVKIRRFSVIYVSVTDICVKLMLFFLAFPAGPCYTDPKISKKWGECMDLVLYRAEISQVLQIIHHLFDFNIEGAVFDDSAVLVTGSTGYLERKGTAVHKPSIMEVIENDEVIVLRPGEMRSCIGCRFSGNCPATLELLKRIVIDGTPVGVLSFSAFSESAHDRIAEQMDYFERIMVDFSDLLATLIKNAHAGDTSVFEKQFSALTSLVSEGLLLVNARGEITASNGPALAMLSGSCLTSIHDFLPRDLSAEVLSAQPVQNQSVPCAPTVSSRSHPSPS